MRFKIWFLFFLSLPFLTSCAVVAVGGAVATTGVILDSREVNTQIDDSGLRLTVHKAIQDDPELAKQRILVIAYQGDILLYGQVLNQALKSKAEKVAHEAGQPLYLFNELEIAHLAPLTQRSKDTWITTQIKSKLLASSEQDTSSVKVVTENGQVFLFGLVEKDVANHAVEVARHVSGVKKVVRVFK